VTAQPDSPGGLKFRLFYFYGAYFYGAAVLAALILLLMFGRQ
jgi:hypothetical protein